MQYSKTIYIIDSDSSARESLVYWLSELGYQARAFSDSKRFLSYFHSSMTGCLLVDWRLPDMSGLELQSVLEQHRCALSVIFLSECADIQVAVKAIKQGAQDFFIKPFCNEALLAAIHHAMKQSQSRYYQYQEHASMEACLSALTKRELEIMQLIVEGKYNKVISIDLGIGEKTVEIHRSRIMRKMKVRTLAELVKKVVCYQQFFKVESVC
ncbi:MAG: hypothetical protein A3F17_00005 [Gammaproteobacteria bacterium RIFCSPHIGHO2_12_FULL_41_15]|nr:MAG: hypothetical protein A3F17_00005 [Gammaproteobacteria bacterium RIFCSPHIGHO2_12_FULL_41_15]